MGIKGNVSISNLSRANENRDWRIYADFAQVLISKAQVLYNDDSDFLLDIRLFRKFEFYCNLLIFFLVIII